MRQAGVEPLRAVVRSHLVGEHVLDLVLEGLGVGGAVEVAVALTPVPPSLGKPVEDIPGRALRPQHGIAIGIQHRISIGVQPRHARLAEVLGDDDVGGYLRPGGGHLGVIHLEDHRAVRIDDP